MTVTVSAGGSEFREDRRRRQLLQKEVVQRLTLLNDWKSAAALFRTVVILGLTLAAALYFWSVWIIVPAIVVIAAQQQSFFVLAHEAAHYRLFRRRWLNELIGRAIGALAGISMCTYRVVHRLHHNHLYQKQDPDIALHGGYPRGKAYLLKKLGKDLSGITAYKTYAYFFGAPALNVEHGDKNRPLDDTAPALRQAAKCDRRWVVATQLALLSAAVLSGYGAEYVLLWLLPALTVLQAILRIRAICEHGAVSDYDSPLSAARTNLAPWWLRWMLFPHHVNYHIEHHLYPAIPHYNLPACHHELRARGLLRDAEVCDVLVTFKKIFADRGEPRKPFAGATL